MRLHHENNISSRPGAHVRVLVVTPIRLYSDGIAHFLRGSSAVDVLATAAEGHTAIELAVALRPDVVVLELALAGSRETSRRLRAALPGTAIVGLGVPDPESVAPHVAEAGMCGYVSRESTLDDLELAIVRAAGGPSGAGDAGPLTTRQTQIVALIDRGLTNKQIAYELRIELATVKNHVHAILEKLGAHTRGEAAATFRRLDVAQR
jgi:DNA-binding NarL/FixJ family response regulator